MYGILLIIPSLVFLLNFAIFLPLQMAVLTVECRNTLHPVNATLTSSVIRPNEGRVKRSGHSSRIEIVSYSVLASYEYNSDNHIYKCENVTVKTTTLEHNANEIFDKLNEPTLKTIFIKKNGSMCFPDVEEVCEWYYSLARFNLGYVIIASGFLYLIVKNRSLCHNTNFDRLLSVTFILSGYFFVAKFVA